MGLAEFIRRRRQPKDASKCCGCRKTRPTMLQVYEAVEHRRFVLCWDCLKAAGQLVKELKEAHPHLELDL